MLSTNSTSCLKLRAAKEYAKDPAAYEHAIAFDTKKYLMTTYTLVVSQHLYGQISSAKHYK